MKNSYYAVTVIVFALLAVTTVGFILIQASSEFPESEDTTVYSEFTSITEDVYVEYSPNVENENVYRQDCNERDGEFIMCGSRCNLTGGEACLTVCEFLCKLPN